MKSLALVVIALVSSSVLAQEIGTEITPTTPTSGANQQQNSNTGNSNTTNTNSNSSQNTGSNANSGSSTGSTYKPKPKDGAPTWDGTPVSATGGSFGIRASFGASGSTALPLGSTSGASVAAPSVGVAFLATNSFKLLVDLGFGMALVGSNALLALSATVGFDYLFRTPGDALRPFIHVGGFFSLVGSSNFVVGFGGQLGGGAEYFFSPSFSLNGRLLVAIPMAVPGSNIVIGIFTLSPGVGATWYF